MTYDHTYKCNIVRKSDCLLSINDIRSITSVCFALYPVRNWEFVLTYCMDEYLHGLKVKTLEYWSSFSADNFLKEKPEKCSKLLECLDIQAIRIGL